MYKKIRTIFKKRQKGQAALTFILAIMGSMTILVSSLGVLTFNEVKKLNNITKSAQSFYAAESGIEDALLRVLTNMTYQNPGTYTLNVANGSTEVDISGPLESLTITSEGNVSGRTRIVEVTLGTSASSEQIAFIYGIQIGYGGMEMEETSQVNGSVFSNGSIDADNNANVTGDVFVAQGTATSADQVNDTPIPPLDSITFGKTTSDEDGVQSFTVSADDPLNKISFYIKKVSTPKDAKVKIVNDNGGIPGSTKLSEGVLEKDQVTGSYGWVDVTFSPNPQLSTGTTYWMVFDVKKDFNKYWIWGANEDGYGNGVAKTGKYSGGPWNSTTLDGYFKIFLGGIDTHIDNVAIGGDAAAYKVTNSTITGDLFCKDDDGSNNKVCDTGPEPPSPQNMPISDANITQWKVDAEAGGTIIGDYTPPDGSTLGPIKITGDLNINSTNQTVTITGTVWVEGNIDIDNSALVKLHTGYGANGGIIVADGWIHLDNLSVVTGSGTAGSYLLLLTTNDCNGFSNPSPTGKTCSHHNSAVDLHENVSASVIYTSIGLLHLHRNVTIQEATAYKLKLAQGAIINYESGLANANFSAGPGAGFKILSWKEIE